MNRNTTLILVGVFAALLLYAVFVQRPADEAKANATPTPGVSTTGSLWGTLTADKILSIQIEDRAGGRRTVFGRTDPAAAWTVSEPAALPADQLAAASYAGTLAYLTYQSAFTPTQALAAYGVLSPTYTIDIVVTDGEPLTLSIGDRTPTGDAYYVVRPGLDQVMVVGAASFTSVFSLLDQPPYLQPTATAVITTTIPIIETSTPDPAVTAAP